MKSIATWIRARLTPSTLIVVASCGLVFAVGMVDFQRESPGLIATVHGRIDDLQQGRNCSACHGGWHGLGDSMRDACIDCHEPIAQQISDGAGLHGTIPADALEPNPNACGHCHAEHHGAKFTIVNERSFRLAGVADSAEFDHSRIGWTMTGEHLELDCTECHEHATAAVLPEEAGRYLGADQSCATCHDDEHEGAFAVSCSECHVQSGFEQHMSLDHGKHLELIGGHSDLSCRACHEAGTPPLPRGARWWRGAPQCPRLRRLPRLRA